jgi:hypothetical protein
MTWTLYSDKKWNFLQLKGGINMYINCPLSNLVNEKPLPKNLTWKQLMRGQVATFPCLLKLMDVYPNNLEG